MAIVITAGKRTPFGAFGKSLRDLTATDLATIASRAAIQQSEIKPNDIDHVIFGNVAQSSADAAYLPRHVGLRIGVPQDVGAFVVNRLCGSGFQSWISAAHMIQAGEANIVLAGGTENMSQIPYVARHARFGMRMGNFELEDSMTSALTDMHVKSPMAITAENLAEKYKIPREEVDRYALQSQSRFRDATRKGIFSQEICPIEIQDKKGVLQFAIDEHARPDTTLESLTKLKPLFKKDGVVTAGNASGIVDGAAASILMTEDEAKKRKIKPLAKIVSWGVVGCDPKMMGIGPVGASIQALQKANLNLNQMDVVDVNEAFAAQYLAVEKELKLNPEITNVNGGAIAVGHPLGASGTRIMNHLMYELKRRKGQYALGSACIGGGQGISIIIERMS